MEVGAAEPVAVALMVPVAGGTGTVEFKLEGKREQSVLVGWEHTREDLRGGVGEGLGGSTSGQDGDERGDGELHYGGGGGCC